MKFLQGAFPEDFPFNRIALVSMFFIALFFAVIELIALIKSLSLSRSITSIIALLHKKATLMAKGNFSYRIDSKRSDQLGELAQSFDRLSQEFLVLLKQAKEKERLEKDLQIAQQVQAIYFPKQLPAPRGLDLFGKCRPARMVSGDYYDFLVQDPEYLDFFLGDVSGKGISAALLMASSMTFLRLEASRKPRPAVSDILSRYNDFFLHNSSDDKFSTLVYARLHRESRKLEYCNAGHLPLLRIRENRVETFSTGGIVPGILPDVDYAEETIELREGDLLVAYTDGFTEVFNDRDEEFGIRRLNDLLAAMHNQSLETIYDTIVERTSSWSPSREAVDDMTMMLLRVN